MIILFNIIYQSPRRHLRVQGGPRRSSFSITFTNPHGSTKAGHSTSVLISYTNPHGGTRGCREGLEAPHGASTSFLISFTNPHGGTVPTNIRTGRAKYISSLILSYRVFFLTTKLTIRIISAKSPALQRPGLRFGSTAAILFLSLSPGGCCRGAQNGNPF